MTTQPPPDDGAKATEFTFSHPGRDYTLTISWWDEGDEHSTAATAADLIAALAASPELMAACADGLSRHTGELRERARKAESDLAAERARVEELDCRRREARQLLTRGMGHCFAVIRQGSLERLSSWCEQVDDYLNRTSDPADILRSSHQSPPPGSASGGTKPQDPSLSGQKVDSEHGQRNDLGATPVRREPGDERLVRGAANSPRDDRRAEGGTEEPRAGAGNHEAGGGATLGPGSDDGRVAAEQAAPLTRDEENEAMGDYIEGHPIGQAAPAAVEPDGLEIPFGCDPEDSAALEKLRMAIDDHLIWPNNEVREGGDYEAAVRHSGELALRFVSMVDPSPPPAKPELPGGVGPDYVTRAEFDELLGALTSAARSVGGNVEFAFTNALRGLEQ